MFRHELHFHEHGGGGSEPVLPLVQQLQLARAGLNQLQPPPQVLPRLLAAFEQQQQRQTLARPAAAPRRAHGWLARWLPVSAGGSMGPDGVRWAMAIALGLTVGLIVLLQPRLPAPVDPWQQPGTLQANFLPLVSPSKMAAGSPAAWLVPAELSHANLASLGAPFDPSRAGETVHAELLVNARGDVLAVRFP